MVMKAPDSHRPYLERRDYTLNVFAQGVFSEEEKGVLKKYGFWLEALATGAIPPVTPLQEQFLRVCDDKAEPLTIFERAWWKLIQRRKFETLPKYDRSYIARTIRETSFGHTDDS